jgi:YHS domain-containing protein
MEIPMMYKDLVCGMEVDPKTAAGKSIYEGKTYYFCSLGCKREFDKTPKKFINKAKESKISH